MVRVVGKASGAKAWAKKGADRLPNHLVSQVKSMGRLSSPPASQERITVIAGNMATDKVKARTNRCSSYFLLHNPSQRSD
jgi:hypothetical protein